jgi:hypothetical protein
MDGDGISWLVSVGPQQERNLLPSCVSVKFGRSSSSVTRRFAAGRLIGRAGE